ncbi:DUF3179 domain-containing (seleno)protein [Nannocystis punicea]|uniref:DUF3179 domain-containing (Seleno)protein n=1 Tax=Nannocystis punicea TaxID=2995304 RepID=A0ABY7GUD7_9BACT|nr:DUF3179 domain-containing (seleno)protein [Nannocystis poenicansa]WAS90544.1 DUF3179 domain-containing (seleno)protein [Nannocystis poenicansa]
MPSNRRPFVLLGLVALLVAVATLVTPLWVMRPFRPQGPTELAVALWVLRFGPWLLFAAGVMAVTALVRAWPGGWWRRSGAIVMLLLTLGAGAMSRVNVFEQMFAPLPAPRFADAAESGLPGEAIVMAVRVGDQARAYPVEVMAYHHVLNDVVGEAPLVVTY